MKKICRHPSIRKKRVVVPSLRGNAGGTNLLPSCMISPESERYAKPQYVQLGSEEHLSEALLEVDAQPVVHDSSRLFLGLVSVAIVDGQVHHCFRLFGHNLERTGVVRGRGGQFDTR